jgi:two-component system response regulator HydG
MSPTAPPSVPASERPTVLVVDDEAPLRYTLRAILEDEDLAVREASDGHAALAELDRGGVDLVLTDLTMPGMDGMALLDALARRPGAPRAILITAHGDERVAVEAMKRGALDYFAKPFDPDEVARVVVRSLHTARLEAENERLRASLTLGRHMLFTSAAMGRVATMVERVARRPLTVLITGESGTGKELVARAIVSASARAERPYLRFNCAALSRELAEAELFGHARGAFTGADRPRPGLFREAHGGTLLLDEIGELDLQSQASLLRVLQEGEVRPVGEARPIIVDVRLLAATHRDLAAEVRAGRFREDLYYRLNVVNLHVPPLRERPEDIVPLAHHFARRFGERFELGEVRLGPSLLARLLAHPWRGNVRELEHCIERLVAMSLETDIDVDPFASSGPASAAAAVADGPGLKERVEAFERGIIVECLREEAGNRSAAARRLGISRVTLLDKIRKYALGD